jgi:hypothetical protein
MADLAFVVVAVGFFGLLVGYVRVLDRMVRAAEEGAHDDLSPPEPQSTEPAR